MTAPPVPVVFIHGLWIHSDAWQPWVELYRSAGYDATAPGWPGDAASADDTRKNPAAVANKGIDDITSGYLRSEELRVGEECRFFGAPYLSSRRRHTRCLSDWSSDVCSSDLDAASADDTRKNPAAVANKGIDDITSGYLDVISALPARPVVIGHSFGGQIGRAH